MGSPPVGKQARREVAGGLVQHALVELRPRLRSAYCFLRLAADTAEPTLRLLAVETRGDAPGLDVRLEHRGRLVAESVDVASRFEALSGPAGCEGRYVVLRLSLRPDRRRGSAAAEVVPQQDAASGAEAALWRPDAARTHRAACAACGEAALERQFRRVLPLPSENWREMLGNVFCHGDGDQSMHDRVRARPGDCFYAASHVVACPADVRCATAEGGDRRLRCAACAAPLGETVEFGVRLWHHRVVWRAEGREELRLAPAAALRRLLRHAAAACDAPAARLLATAPRHEPLLLWIVDPSFSVHVVDKEGEENGLAGEGEKDEVSGQESGAEQNGDKDQGRSENGGRGDGGAAARPAMKILFRRCDEEAARRHRADLQVAALELDEALMGALVAELADSQRWYPESQRRVGEDEVGLLLL